MCTALPTRFGPLMHRGPLSVVVLSLLLFAGCDTSDPGTDPPEEETAGVTSTAVTVQSDTLGLPGTILEPDTSAAVPGVVLVHGSGPVDRNGQVDGANIPPIFRHWAERMAERGVAVLRYDKRTTLAEVQQADPRAVTFLDFVHDAVAAGRLLRNREAVDADHVVIVGHSQGGNVAPAAATRLDGTAGAVSLAGPALAIDSLIVAQLKSSPATPDSVAQAARATFDSLRANPPPPDSLIAVGENRASVAFFRQWMRHSERIDSVAAVLDAPLLALQGRADQRYPGETLERSLSSWRRITQTDDATLKVYDGVDHLLLEEGTNRTAEAPISDLIAWIQNR